MKKECIWIKYDDEGHIKICDYNKKICKTCLEAQKVIALNSISSVLWQRYKDEHQ